jgi:hypothetical protein
MDIGQVTGFICVLNVFITSRLITNLTKVTSATNLISPMCVFLYRATTACLQAKIEDVVRFRVASEVVTMIIKNFGYSNLFPRENYEFYARITGRTLRLDDNWQFTFQYPASEFVCCLTCRYNGARICASLFTVGS